MTDPKKKFRLSKVVLDEISLVDNPAEPNSLIHFFKRGDPDNHRSGSMPDDLKTMIAEMQTATETITTLTKRATDAEAAQAAAEGKVTELEAKLAKAAAPAIDPTKPSEIAKSISDPAIREAFEALVKQNEASSTALANMADERALAKMRDTIAVDFADLPGVKPETFAPVLKRALGVLSPEDSAELTRVLKSANAVCKAGLMHNIGKGGLPTPAGAEAEIEAKAQEIQKGDATMTYAQAYKRAMETNPALYKRFLDEQGQRQ